MSPNIVDFDGFLTRSTLCPHMIGWSTSSKMMVQQEVRSINRQLEVYYDKNGFVKSPFSEPTLPRGYYRSLSLAPTLSSGIIRCACCFMECQLDLRWYEGHGLALYCTIWKDLGSGPADLRFISNWDYNGPGQAFPTRFFPSLRDAYENLSTTGVATTAEEFQSFLDRMPEDRASFLGTQKEYLRRAARSWNGGNGALNWRV